MTTLDKQAVIEAALDVNPNDPFYKAAMIDAEAVHLMANPPQTSQKREAYRWISVLNREKPTYAEKVLACFPDEKEAQICFYGGATHIYNGHGGKVRKDQFFAEDEIGFRAWESTEATHWMHFPKPPKEGF